jgi:NCK-associated protein 1
LEQTKALPFLSEQLMKKCKKDNKKQQQQNQSHEKPIKPGNESVRVNREDTNLLDKMNVVLAEWCFALNYATSIPVWEYTFYPKEYLYLKLESLFHKTLTEKCISDKNSDRSEKIRTYLRPSEMINVIESYMRIMLSIENYGNLN